MVRSICLNSARSAEVIKIPIKLETNQNLFTALLPDTVKSKEVAKIDRKAKIFLLKLCSDVTILKDARNRVFWVGKGIKTVKIDILEKRL